VNIAKLPTLLRGDYCLAAENQKCRVTLIGHRRAKSCSCCAAQQAFSSDLTKIKAGNGALREFITMRHRRLRNGSQGSV